MDNSKHHFNIKGKDAEEFVHELALKTFLTDWCYLNPDLPDGKELCDLLVVFDNVAIIWQIKNLKLDANGSYKQSEVEKNLRQLAGARRQLFDLKTTIELENPRRIKEKFDPTTINEVYLISVLLGKGEAYFSFVKTIKDYKAHVFTRDFTEAVLTELDTIADFTAYLRAKETLVQLDKQIIILGGEEELLAFYLLNDRSFARFDEATLVMSDSGSWERLQNETQYLAKKKEDEISYGWDNIINRTHECAAGYEPVARELARPTRFQRRCLGKSFFDAHVQAHNDSISNPFRRVISFEGMTYCFLFCDERDYSEARKAMLHDFCYIARIKFPANLLVLGIATEKHFAPVCSYDFCLLKMPTLTSENQSKIEEIQRKTGILVNPAVTRVEEKEYPD